jgi:hypothetical protein
MNYLGKIQNTLSIAEDFKDLISKLDNGEIKKGKIATLLD